MNEIKNSNGGITVSDGMEVCPFCGQLHIEGGSCDCSAAVVESLRKDRVERAYIALRKMCAGGVSAQIEEYLRQGIELVSREVVAKIKADFDGTSITVSGDRQAIKLDRVDKQKTTESV